MTAPQIKAIPLVDIVPSGDNQRNINEKSESFQELTASIKAGGVRGPIQVRDNPKKKGQYILCSGERRYEASKAAGLDVVTALVYLGITDDEALDLMYIENKFREDLKPMEEAAEVALLVERMGGDVKKIADRIGETEKWVRLRANIHSKLIKPWKDIFSNLDKYPEFRTWTVTHLTRVARLPAHIQKELLKSLKNHWGPGYSNAAYISVKDLDATVADELKLLPKAKWDLDDETLLPKAGACSKCEKRTGHQPMLWFDSEEQIEAGDQCTDAFCWRAKEMAWLERRAAELRTKHPKLMLVMSNPTRGRDAEQITGKMGAPLSPHQYKICSKTSKGAVPAMYVNNKGIGKLTYIKINAAGGGRMTKPKGKPTPLKKRCELLDAKRWAQVLLDLRERVEATEVTDICYKRKVTGVMALVAIYGNESLWPFNIQTCQREIKDLVTTANNGGREKALEHLWNSVKPTLDRILTYNGAITQTLEHFKDEAKWIAELVQADLDAMFKDVAGRKGFTEPKSWKGLNANGTPKAVKPAEKKTKSKKAKKASKAKSKAGSDAKEYKDAAAAASGKRSCRICGCTDTTACMDGDQPCHWVEEDLCSKCRKQLDQGGVAGKKGAKDGKEAKEEGGQATQ